MATLTRLAFARSCTFSLHLHHRAPSLPHRLPLPFFRKMSAAASLGKLQAPLRDLVIGATEDGGQDFGKSEKEKADIAEWIDKVAQGDITRVENLKASARRVTAVQPVLTLIP